MMQHMTLVLFVWVLANQAGVPVPVAPWLLAAGALAGSGNLSFTVVLASAVGGALGADLAWFGLGRWRGAQMLAACFQLLRVSPASVDRVARVFRTHQLGLMWSARFLPELNPVTAGLAGATRVRLARFLRHAFGSALAWAGVWTGGGYLLGGATAESPDPFGIRTTVLITVALAAVAVSGITFIGWSRGGSPPDAADAGTGRVANLERRRAHSTAGDMERREPRRTDTRAASARDHLSQAATAA